MYFFSSTLRTFVRDTRYLASALFIISFLYMSCSREVPVPSPGMASPGGQSVPVEPEERALVKRISQVATVLEVIYQDPGVVAEVHAAIGSEYYEDERVLLSDLLYPEKSELYALMAETQTEANQDIPIQRGRFSRYFRQAAYNVLGKQRAEELIFLARNERENVSLKNSDASNPSAGAASISIYHPYSEDFSRADRPLVVPATVEADWVDIPDPECRRKHQHEAVTCEQIRVDESYVQHHPVHIVGIGAERKRTSLQLSLAGSGQRTTLSGDDGAAGNLIYLGKVRCTRQYDRLISFTGNGGGSELKFIRGSAYITLNNNQQVSNTEFDVISVYFRRKDIRKEREKHVYAIWDPDWESECTEQVFGIYEEDRQGEREFSGSIDVKVKYPEGETKITPVSYSYSLKTQDDIIRQINWNRISFFRYNRIGLGGCGLKSGYSWYDCHLPVSYSLPQL